MKINRKTDKRRFNGTFIQKSVHLRVKSERVQFSLQGKELQVKFAANKGPDALGKFFILQKNLSPIP